MLRMIGFHLFLFVLAVGSAPAMAADLVIYDNASENGFDQTCSFNATPNFAETTVVHSAPNAISFDAALFGAVSWCAPGSLSTTNYSGITFWANGGPSGGQNLQLVIGNGGNVVASTSLDSLLGHTIAPNAWVQVTASFDNAPMALNSTFDQISIQDNSGNTAVNPQPTVYFDDVSLIGRASGTDWIFKSGFEGSVLPPPACGMTQDHDVTVGSMVSDRFTWCDSANAQRVAVLAHNDGQTGPGGTRGGELRQFSYKVGASTRTVNASSSGTSGFGYVVSHPISEDNCTGQKLDNTYSDPYDTSLIGHARGGSFQRVFEGRHHSIFRFTTTYPRYCSTIATPPLGYLVPVTIDWIFATGRDNPLWSVTWDMTAVPADKLEDDTRAPYGELLFDGSASEGAHSTIAGVAWGDRYKFTSTTNPVTLSSAWSWDQPNTIPFVKLWTTVVDATMGTVMTQTIVQKDVAGYFDVAKFWTHTNADALPNCNPPFATTYTMPCIDFWSYQSINFSFAGNNVATNSTRLAWGSEYGFLGQSAYHIHGSTYWGGPLPDATASGWPKKSYSLYVVLGTHTNDPVDAQVTQTETFQTLTMSATIGSVISSGPAGINRVDTVSYAPAGYNHVYGALAFAANAANKLDANVVVGSGTLKKPLLILSNYAGAYPSSVKLNGTSLTVDVDYFPSMRAGSDELWITFNQNFSGATNHIQITP
jgi:hypothetical protein